MMRKMKESGIEWIGQIPEEWEYVRLKHFYEFEKGKNAATYTQEYIGENEGIYPVYSGQTENNGIMGNINSFDYDIEECLFTTTVGAKVMTPKILKGKFSLSQNCLIMKQIKNCNNKYFYYMLLPLFDYEKSLIPTYMQPSLRIEDLKTYAFYIPNIAEQQKIADFLDDKVGEIDAIILKTIESIEVYKKYKQAVITEAVTKGLDDSILLKESGIEWIGKIPATWDVLPLKYKVLLNQQTLSETTSQEYEFDYIEIGSVNLLDGVKQYEHMKFADAPSRARRVVKKNDIIVSTVRTYLKAIAKIPDKMDLIASTGFAVLTPHDIDADYLAYMIKTDYFTETVTANSVGVSYPAINASELIGFKILLPSVHEQVEIAKYLDKKCGEIDALIAKKEAFVDEMETYKKSLIYEYVTGKKEV